jgi:DNA-directed RNA polymerase subunit M/transcription elongation factor TFIIS
VNAARLPRRARQEQSGPIDGLHDIARFALNDPDVLVTASLACPLCLRTEEVEWRARLQGYDPSVQCRCVACNERWRVYLTPDQALRIALMQHAHAA